MAKTDPFAAYKLPVGLTEGVEIPLPNTPAVFRVLLPGTMNEDFNMSMLAELNMEPDDDGNVRVNQAAFQMARKRMFFDKCIVESRGLPDGMDATQFFDSYPLAARLVFERATELANVADEQASEALGKLKPTQIGRSSGVGDTVSMTT